MELVKVTIKNFQSIKAETTIKINNTITTIIGLNESGKSTILKAIDKLNGYQIEKNEKNKEKKYKNAESYIIGRFLLSENEIKEINKRSNNKVLLFPERDTYIDIKVCDEPNTRFLSISEKKGKEYVEFDLFYNLKDNLIHFTNNLFLQYNLEKGEDFDSCLKASEEDNLENVYNNLIQNYKEQEIYDKLSEISGELKKDLWADLIPNVKIVIFSSSNLLQNEVMLSDIKDNIQVNNLLKIANIDVDELIRNIENDDSEEIKTYENIYKDGVTKTFKKIFRQNDSNFNFQIRIDTKNNKIIFYTFDKTSGASPIPLQDRSDGFKWYFSIYITLYEYLQRKDDAKYILLFDEPNLYLNPSAQFDLLERVFKNEFKNDQIIYTTHSPYMIDASNFSSIRIVEKTSSTKIYNTTVDYLKEHKTTANEIDPLMPILTALNLDISNNLIIDRNKKAIVVEGIGDIYILKAMCKKLGYEDKLMQYNFIPCFGAEKVPLMFGYLYGIGYDVYALTDNDNDGITALKKIMGPDRETSVLYNKLMTYNKQIDENKSILLENLISEQDLTNNLIPKNTVLYRDFYDNIKKIKLEKATLNNFQSLFDYIIEFTGGNNE